MTLVTPSRSGLKVLIEICEQYADDYCVKFINGTPLWDLQSKSVGHICIP